MLAVAVIHDNNDIVRVLLQAKADLETWRTRVLNGSRGHTRRDYIQGDTLRRARRGTRDIRVRCVSAFRPRCVNAVS